MERQGCQLVALGGVVGQGWGIEARKGGWVSFHHGNLERNEKEREVATLGVGTDYHLQGHRQGVA